MHNPKRSKNNVANIFCLPSNISLMLSTGLAGSTGADMVRGADLVCEVVWFRWIGPVQSVHGPIKSNEKQASTSCVQSQMF